MPVQTVCRNCGKIIFKKPSVMKRNINNYCDWVCRFKLLNSQEMLKARFMKHVTIVSENKWLWRSTKVNGYGQFEINGEKYYAHRAAYKLFVGEIPKGKCILLKDGNGLNVNSNNLLLADRSGINKKR